MANGNVIELQPDHPSNRLDGLTIVSFEKMILTLKAQKATEGLIVIKSTQPLTIESVTRAKAQLKPGWDGTLGYGLYGLQLSVQEAGEVTVKLKNYPPPSAPNPTTESQLAAFKRAFQARSSRFPNTSDGFRKWQQSYRGKLAGLLMNGKLPKHVPLNPRIIETQDFPKFVLHKVEYHSQADRTNTLLLSLPKGANKSPLLLALHGHEAIWGEADAGAYSMGHNDDFCAYFAERGWAVLQPATMNHQLQHPGWTLQGEWTWDAMAALDYAASVAEVNMNRVAVCGLSTGAHLVMNVLALDDRVQAGVVGCILSTWHHAQNRIRIPPHCDCGISFQIGPYLEQCDWAALAAPKPVQYQHGRKDACFCPGADPKGLNLEWNTGIMPEAEYQAMFAEVERAYGLSGKSAQVETRFHDEGHRVNNEAAFEWLEKCFHDVD